LISGGKRKNAPSQAPYSYTREEALQSGRRMRGPARHFVVQGKGGRKKGKE